MIVVGGENLIDMVQSETQGQWPSYTAIPGGAPYNVALACARQGAAVGYATPISTDTLGNQLADRVLADGVVLLAPRRADPSSMAVVSLTNGQARYAFYREGTAERGVTFASLQANMPDDTKILMVGGLAITGGADAEAWHQIYAASHAKGLITAMDPNIRHLMISDREAYLARFEAMLAVTDALKLSDEDLEWLYPGTTPEQGLDVMRQKSSAHLIVITKGSEGAIGLVHDTVVAVPAGQANPFMDTVGAGDTFMATLVAELDRLAQSRADVAALGQKDLQAMMERAALAAAINCSRAGCNPPYLAELPPRG